MVFIGDTATIIITVQDSDGAALNISAATTKEIIVKRPGLTAVALPAAFTNTGTDGKIQIDYEDITVVGQYQVQGKVVLSGNTYHTAIDDFSAGAPLL